MTGGMCTPWGVALTQQQLDEHVFWVETVECGGLLIDASYARMALSDKAYRIGQPWSSFIAYEQEHDMMVVFYEHPEWYLWVEEELTQEFAEDLVRQYHPEYFAPVTAALACIEASDRPLAGRWRLEVRS